MATSRNTGRRASGWCRTLDRFNLFENPDGSHGLDVTRWKYETAIDTAITITIPAPGALPLFATTALLTPRRRRQC